MYGGGGHNVFYFRNVPDFSRKYPAFSLNLLAFYLFVYFYNQLMQTAPLVGDWESMSHNIGILQEAG